MLRNRRILSINNNKTIHPSRHPVSLSKRVLSQRDYKRTLEVSKILDIDFKIQVCVRIRAIPQSQMGSGCLKMISSTSVNLEDSQKKQKSYTFNFDRIFSATTSNKQINEILCKQLVDGALSGYNSSIFAYGSTGSGKTFTMFGNTVQLGLVQYSVQRMFLQIEKEIEYNDFVIKLVCVQLYNENLYDLMSDNIVELRESPIRGTFLSGAIEKMVSSKLEVFDLIRKATARRQTNANHANENSSRSHAIIQIYIEKKELGQGIIQEVKYSKLSMIDLAGSEKLHLNRNNYESKKINQSLLVLGNCIQQLYRNCQKGTKNHIPYRDSKLTRLLKDSLGGNTRTMMISTVSPASFCFDETFNTLVYASHANKIKLRIKQNVKEINKNHMAEYQKIIDKLKEENQRIKKKLLGQADSLVKYEDYKKQLEKGFKKEMKIRKRLLQVDCRIQEIEFDQYRTYYINSRSEKMYRKKPIQSQKQQKNYNLQYKQLTKEKNELTEQFTKTLQQREQIMKQLTVGKTGTIQNKNGEFIEYFKKKLLEIEIDQLNEEKKEKNNKRMELEKQNFQMITLIEQLKLREKIINKQNIMLGENQKLEKGNKQWVSQFLDNLDIIPKEPLRVTPLNKSKKNVSYTEPSINLENDKDQQQYSNKRRKLLLHPSKSIQQITPEQSSLQNLSRRLIYGRSRFKRPPK